LIPEQTNIPKPIGISYHILHSTHCGHYQYISLGALLSQPGIMPPSSPFLIKTPLSRLDERDYMQSQGRNDSDFKSPVAMVGVVIAALTLLATLIPLFRCPRVGRWVSSLSIPSLVKKALGSITPANTPPTITTATEDIMSAVSGAGVAIPEVAWVILQNDYSNIHFVVGYRMSRRHWDQEYPNQQSLGGPHKDRHFV
ncbi:hypothetical protein HOY80DRAFT_467280, partial [Tuber brumale]